LTAYVYAFWENQADYDQFMEEEHDQIFVKSDQESSYESIDVSFVSRKAKDYWD
jgi:hypothetical protein